MTEMLWKGVAIALLLALLGVAGKLWLTDRDLNKAEKDLAVAQQSVANLQVGINQQNAAIAEMKSERDAQMARADAAWQMTTGIVNKANAVMAKVQNIKPQKCEDAMPIVDQVIEAIK